MKEPLSGNIIDTRGPITEEGKYGYGNKSGINGAYSFDCMYVLVELTHDLGVLWCIRNNI